MSAKQETMDISLNALMKCSAVLKKRIQANATARAKHADGDAQSAVRFADSEVDLHEALVALMPFTSETSLIGSIPFEDLAALLAHENVDIVEDVLDVLHELTSDLDAETAKPLFETLLPACGFLDQLADSVFPRLNFSVEGDATIALKALAILENLAETDGQIMRQMFSAHGRKLADYFLAIVDEQRGLSLDMRSEVLDVLISCLPSYLGADENVMNRILTLLAVYRERFPTDEDEVALYESLIDLLCSVFLTYPAARDVFARLEGGALLWLLLQQAPLKHRSTILKAIDFSVMQHRANCTVFIDAGGLKGLFTCLPQPFESEHVISITFSLISNTNGVLRARVLAKLMFDKSRLASAVDAFVRFRRKAHHQQQSFGPADLESDGTLLCVQMLAVILLEAAGTDVSSDSHAEVLSSVEERLAALGSSLDEVVTCAEDWAANVGEDEEDVMRKAATGRVLTLCELCLGT
jgi:beta-catenin-like protein 1